MQITPLKMSKIINNIYLGDINDALRLDKDYWMIVTCASEAEIDSDFRINLLDGKQNDTLQKISEASKFIYENKNHDKNIFVHCMAGASRSASVIIYYLMSYHKMNFIDAYYFVKDKRAIVHIDKHFEFILRSIDKDKSTRVLKK